ncbi:serine hydroxymethyltransferase 6 [Lactuca sativa]|uniref:Serine hydroxymethyltransferase n=1 Tax=Lactuca sativa TaxID=4236 RepID=A0A9R1XA66_LACSA|nr:serine hydroxymethyltransferase 6 [Lactuca sativa]KAJ0206635.1 hypothetical protein LSAT_V11C500266590 [Lactuca sativa]
MPRASRSNVSLGFLPHSSHHSQLSDGSISFQIDSSFNSSSRHLVSSIPLQLMEEQTTTESNSVELNNQQQQRNVGSVDLNGESKIGGEEEEEKDVDNFQILGHPMCLKRRRDDNSSGATPESSSSSTSSKRCQTDQNGQERSLESRRQAVRAWGNQSLQAADPDIFDILEKEKQRQYKGIELIASENFVCKAVLEALGSHLTNKYSEGMPGARYYSGNQYIDEIEILCCQRALTAFGLESENWGVNVQPYSCTSANFAVYTGLLSPGDRIMGLDTPSGGHTSHGYYTPNGKKVSGASIFFESLSYKVNPQTGIIDFEKLEERALDFRPKILICGGSSYPRDWEYAKFRQIADKSGAVLMCDMAQISGLIAAKECASPFDFCDIVTSTTHKSLRGPRGGIIFYRKGLKPGVRGKLLNQGDGSYKYDFEEKINFAVCPALQGGPHNNHIAALAIALKQLATPDYKAYMQQVKKNAQALASALLKRNCKLVTGGTDNHLVLWDLRNLGLTGKNFEKVCEMCHITVNKIAIFDDNGSLTPGGVRIGTPAMTTRGCLESDFETMAEFLYRAAQITSVMQQREHGKMGKAFVNKDIVELRSQVENFATQFAMPGQDM